MADDTIAQHNNLAAFHTYEMGRADNPELPAWDSDEAAQRRTEYRYLIQLAHRRSQSSCVLVAIERIAASLAITDGEPWPACNRAISPDRTDLQRLAISASRRQRYRHLARVVHAELMNYYELGTEDEASRQQTIAIAALQMAEDKRVMMEQRQMFGLPSTVSQLNRGCEK